MKKLFSIVTGFTITIGIVMGNVFAHIDPFVLYGTSRYIEMEHEEDMAVQITSGKDSYGGIDFDSASETTFADIKHLSADYALISGGCGGGSPRFQISLVDPNSNIEHIIYAYIGEGPAYFCDPTRWYQSGNLLTAGRFVDATQAGGLFYTPYDEALIYLGNHHVNGIEFIVDSGWMFENQSVVIDNIQVNEEAFAFPLKNPSQSSIKPIQ